MFTSALNNNDLWVPHFWFQNTQNHSKIDESSDFEISSDLKSELLLKFPEKPMEKVAKTHKSLQRAASCIGSTFELSNESQSEKSVGTLDLKND